MVGGAVLDRRRQLPAVAAGPPVPFVGLQTGLEGTVEQRFETRAGLLDQGALDEALDEEEAVFAELLDLCLAQLHLPSPVG